MIPPDLGSPSERHARRRVEVYRGVQGVRRGHDGDSITYHRPSRHPLSSADSFLGQPRARGTREAIVRPSLFTLGWDGGRLCVTPRQTCPRPNGLGRNLRSKTRWFTGFCNSHQVSHFATFFIDARAEISVAESHFSFSMDCAVALTVSGAATARSFRFVILDAIRAGGSLFSRTRRGGAASRRMGRTTAIGMVPLAPPASPLCV